MKNMIDLHLHTTASDGADTAPELLEQVRTAGLRIFSVTDHDTIDGALEMEALVPEGLHYIRGIEFSCITPLKKCHILGYGFDPNDAVFRRPWNWVSGCGRRSWSAGWISGKTGSALS